MDKNKDDNGEDDGGDSDQNAKKNKDSIITIDSKYISPSSPTACTTSVTAVGTVGGSATNKVTVEIAKKANYAKGLTVFAN